MGRIQRILEESSSVPTEMGDAFLVYGQLRDKNPGINNTSIW